MAADIKETADGLLADHADRGDLKLIARAMSELRDGFRLFKELRPIPKVTVFGSARTLPEDPVYQHAVAFGRAMAEAGYMVITGAGPGIMEAAHVGAGQEKSIGVAIMLPFEEIANTVVADNDKLINLRYFFTRKLMFVKETNAIILFPGGFGTLDECFETLTMVQTGKSNIIPIVMVDIPGGKYWADFDRYIREELLDAGMISPEDMSLYHVTTSIEEAVGVVRQFYRVYHSQRYVRGQLVLRLQRPLSDATLARLNEEFADIVSRGTIEQGSAHPHESNEPGIEHLPRLTFSFSRRSFGRLRQMIDVINQEP